MKTFNRLCMGLTGLLCWYFAWRLHAVGATFGTFLFGFFACAAFFAIPYLKGRR